MVGQRRVAILEALRPAERLLVWCGNSHTIKITVDAPGDVDWVQIDAG